jgi:putative DNA primase/helicase
MATNHRPKVRGTDHGIWSRLRLIPFNVTFSEEQQDKQLDEKLQAEGAGILNWAIEGARMWVAEGLNTPAIVTATTAEYRAEQDLLTEFLEQVCTTDDKSAITKATDLYAKFTVWSRDAGELPRSSRWLGVQLAGHGFEKTKLHGERAWRGVALIGATGAQTVYPRWGASA